MIIKKVEWDQIKHIPKTYPKEFAMFAQHKNPHIWLGAFLKDDKEDFPRCNLQHLIGVGKILFAKKTVARMCSVFVLPPFRKMGVSKLLTKEREKIAVEKGCTKIDYVADVSLEWRIPKGFLRKERVGKNAFRYEKDFNQ